MSIGLKILEIQNGFDEKEWYFDLNVEIDTLKKFRKFDKIKLENSTYFFFLEFPA